jgi:succinoglycan biosynthesis transport protein ExoP
MLQIGKSTSTAIAGPTAVGQEFETPAEAFASLVGFIRRRFPLIAAVMALVVGMAVVYILTAPPRYTAEARLIVDPSRTQLPRQQTAANDAPIDPILVESQVEILQSEKIALSVIKDLHLTEDSEFVGAGGGLLGVIARLMERLLPSDGAELERSRSALANFKSRLNVKRVGQTYVINIGFSSFHPDRAAQVASAVAETYILDQLEAKYQSSRRAAVWLQDRLKELRQQASAAERAVVDYNAKNNIVDTGGRLMNEQQLAELNSALIQARAHTSEAKARLERVSQVLQEDVPDERFAGATATVADSLHNEVITRLRQHYLDLSAREADFSARLGRNHLAVVYLRSQMREIRNSILDELKRIAETYKSDYEIAKARQESIQKNLDQIVSDSTTTNKEQIVGRELESTATSYRALYDNFLQNYMESVQQQSFPLTQARVITEASQPSAPSAPKKLLILMIAAGGGLVLGVGIGLLREVSDRVFRTSGRVEEVLQMNCLAVLPNIKSVAEGGPPTQAPPGARTILRDQSLPWHAIDAPFSRFAESLRGVKIAIDIAAKSKKVIGITSSLPNEGKSTVASAFAQLLADGGARVILVDCDLRNPALTRKLAPTANIGILDVVADRAALEEVTWTDSSTGLVFLPAAVMARLAHTSEVLASDAMKKLFDRLRQAYDYIIVDLPPLAPVVDVRATTALVDSYLFVIQWGHTKIDVVEHVLNITHAVYDSILGVVLNKADMHVLNRYENYRSDYYRNPYYARYGYSD